MERLLTMADVCRLLRVSRETIRSWARQGVLPAGKLHSGRWRFKPSDIEAFQEKMRDRYERHYRKGSND